jgi:hypothetical protein
MKRIPSILIFLVVLGTVGYPQNRVRGPVLSKVSLVLGAGSIWGVSDRAFGTASLRVEPCVFYDRASGFELSAIAAGIWKVPQWDNCLGLKLSLPFMKMEPLHIKAVEFRLAGEAFWGEKHGSFYGVGVSANLVDLASFSVGNDYETSTQSEYTQLNVGYDLLFLGGARNSPEETPPDRQKPQGYYDLVQTQARQQFSILLNLCQKKDTLVESVNDFSPTSMADFKLKFANFPSFDMLKSIDEIMSRATKLAQLAGIEMPPADEKKQIESIIAGWKEAVKISERGE